MRHSDVVYNLVGRDWETKNFSYTDVHATAAGDIARIAREEGVDRLVHVSHLNADVNSPSAFYRVSLGSPSALRRAPRLTKVAALLPSDRLQTKAEGEALVREEFPEASIVRPSAIFGYEDRLCNQIASSCRSSALRAHLPLVKLRGR